MARRSRVGWQKALAGAAQPLVIIHDGAIQFCNAGWCHETGWDAELLEGMSVAASRPPASGPEFVCDALSPPAECDAGQLVSRPIAFPDVGGRTLRRTAWFVPIGGAESPSATILVVVGSGSEAAGLARPTDVTGQLHAEMAAMRLEARRRMESLLLVGNDPRILRLRTQIEMLSKSDCSWFIHGPAGSGRRHVARMVHVRSGGRDHSFVVADCRLLTPSHLRQLTAEAAESSEDSIRAQERVGLLVLFDPQWIPDDVQEYLENRWDSGLPVPRICAVSETPPTTLVEQGAWRRSFAARLTAITMESPSLDHRGDDIVLLTQYFIEQCRRMQQTIPVEADVSVLDAFRDRDWPGNIEELRQVVDDACRRATGRVLKSSDLPWYFQAGVEAQQTGTVAEADVSCLDDLLQEYETNLIQAALDASSGNKAEASRRLGLTRPRLYRRMQQLGLE